MATERRRGSGSGARGTGARGATARGAGARGSRTRAAAPARRGGNLSGGVHLLLGPEAGRKRAFVEQIVAAAEASHGNVEVLRAFPYDSDLIDLVATMSTPGLFVTHQVVLLQEAQDLRAGNQLTALAAYCQDPAPASTLILTANGMARDLPAALTHAVSKERTRIFWEMFDSEKQGWLLHFFRSRDIRIDAAACDLILELVPADVASLEALCGSLASFFGAGASISAPDIDQFLYHGKEETVFSLFDRVAERDLQGCLETVTTLLLSRRGDAVQIIGVLLSQFQRLTQLKELLAGRTGEAAAMQKLRITGKRLQRTYREAHRRYPDAEMEPIYRLLVEFDTRARLLSQELTEPLLQLLLYHVVARGGRGAWRQFRV